MSRATRILIPDLREFLRSLQDSLERNLATPDREDIRHAQRSAIPQDWNAVAICHYLLDDEASAADAGRRVIETAHDYFFGEWRDHTPWGEQRRDRAYWKRLLEWRDHLIYALGWSLALGLEDDARRLAEYPDEECPADAERDRTALYLGLCRFILQDGANEPDEYLRKAAASGRPSVRLIGQALQLLHHKQADQVKSALQEHFAKHARKNRPPSVIVNAANFDGSVIMHLSKKRGIEVALPPADTDFLLDPLHRLQ